MRAVVALSLALGLWSGAVAVAQDTPASDGSRFFTLAGGAIGGNYFEIARVLCREVNRVAVPGMRCSPEATPGSVYNLDGMRSGELDLAIVQSDWLEAAGNGTGRFAAFGPFDTLRGVSELYREAITVVAGSGSDMADAGDLDGRRIDIGPPASGRRATMERIFTALRFDRARLALVSELPAAAALDELCAGRLDAVILVVGHPDATVARAVEECGARLLPLAGTTQGEAIAALGDYLPETIAAGTYPSLDAPVATYGVTATLVSLATVPDEIVGTVVRVLSTRQEPLVRGAPVLDQRGTAPLWSGLGGVEGHSALPSPG
jgi:hypothetical protein